MNRNLNFIVTLLLALTSLCSEAQTPAFPGAGGGGMYTTGGRGGKVLYVTSLADNTSAGTLRWAINQTGPRIIMFKVSGTITLNSRLSISRGDVTIAGQTAPGDGICLRNYDVYIGADNVIIRFIRFRLGNDVIANESDAIWGRNQKNVIIDHCSMSWSIDECASFYANQNFTMQWCYLTESLNNAGHSKGAHGYAGLWGGKNASFHHNLLAHHVSRNPRFNGWKRSGLNYENSQDEERLDFRNNVVYNWGDNSSYGGESLGKYNIVGNYFKYGPATKSNIRYKITQVDKDGSAAYAPGHGSYFIENNYVYGSSSVTANNWTGVTYASGVTQTAARVNEPFAYLPIAEHTAEVAFEKVLNYGGASLVRDAIDTRISNEVLNGTATFSGSVTKRPGIIDNPNDVGGWPVYQSTTAPIDSDNDGIPDGWLAANYPGKISTDLNEQGYTYLEVYINSLVEHIVAAHDTETIISSVRKPLAEAKVQVTYHAGTSEILLTAEQNIREVKIYDIAGRTLVVEMPSERQVTLNLSLLNSALYIVHISLDDGSKVSRKIVR
ncbi:MAG: T9SS type A sorting domain-containing protein [Paludibacter sp.]|nr:T9SS type A sorting domain-containing protein [Paludibacter sp.]